MALLVLAGVVLAAAAALWSKRAHVVLGAESFLYGYPLVIVDVTRVQSALVFAAPNRLQHMRKFPDASFHDVVRPNVDTLYSTAFIDAAQGPWVFEWAGNDQRYALMPFMDAWTNVFAAPGTRTSGTGAGRFMLVGPAWRGPPPPGLDVVRAPTRIVWLIARTQTNGVADYPLVHRLQDGMTLRGRDDWQSGKPAPDAVWRAGAQRPVAPVEQMRAMGTVDFFTRLALLMVDNPSAAADAPMLGKLARIGIAPGQPPQWSLLERTAVSLGRLIAERAVARELAKPRGLVRGWSTPPAVLGNYGTSYSTRAAVAMVGLGANLPADAMYPNTRVDGSGQALDGDHRYRLHFAHDQLPPVHAFWSLTAYGVDDFLIDNPLRRYALGDRDPLVFNADGSLDLWIQAQAPDGERRRNWLPVKAGAAFLLNARLYWPADAALDGSWGMPAVERID